MLASVPLVRQVVLSAVAVVVLTLGAASPSWAHTALSSTTPADGEELSVPPSEIVLDFTDEVIELGAVVSVTGPSGSVDAGPLAASGQTLAAELPASLPAGSYSVDWRVSASDGHPISGTFSFSVTSSTAAAGPAVSATAPAPATETAGTTGALDEAEAASGESAADGSSWATWLFVATAVLLGLLLAAFAFVRSQRRR